MREFTFGQYYPENSIIHRLDARVKIVMTIAFMVAIFLVEDFIGFLIPIAFLAVEIALSKVPFKYVLKTLKPIVFLVVFTAILNLLFYTSGEIIWEFYFIKIRDEALVFCGFMALRLILLVMGSSVMTLTTQPVELSDGIESLMSPLKLVKFPVHELALIMSIALRFIPTLTEEADRIIRAQKARGADFESGNIFAKAKSLIPILIPLLVSSFRRADELADAMDARCYGGSAKRTKYKVFRIRFADIVALVLTAALIAAIVVLNSLIANGVIVF